MPQNPDTRDSSSTVRATRKAYRTRSIARPSPPPPPFSKLCMAKHITDAATVAVWHTKHDNSWMDKCTDAANNADEDELGTDEDSDGQDPVQSQSHLLLCRQEIATRVLVGQWGSRQVATRVIYRLVFWFYRFIRIIGVIGVMFSTYFNIDPSW